MIGRKCLHQTDGIHYTYIGIYYNYIGIHYTYLVKLFLVNVYKQ